jgi:hypothetical protein
VPPDQLEVQFALLQDIIETLPTDILDDSDKFGEELLMRGVAEILIRLQLENMARLNATRHAFDQSLERLPSALEENAGDHTTWSAALPLRFRQRVHDAEAEEARSLVTEQTDPDFKSADNQPFPKRAMPGLSASVPIPISLLSVFDQNGHIWYSRERCELLRADLYPVTNSLHVEVRAHSSSAHDKPVETSDDIGSTEAEEAQQKDFSSKTV